MSGTNQGPPVNLGVPPLSGTVHVDTSPSMPPPPIGQNQAGQSSSNSDVAGVLRRNQACLNCRRRKLKCDALRPHCSTCVRSHKHLLRTSPKSNPVLNCEYDDSIATGPAASGSGRDSQEVITIDDEEEDTPEDASGDKKKKRKATGEAKRRKKKDDNMDEDTEALRKKIEALEAQLQQKNEPASEPRNWNGGPAFSGAPINAPSPTAFLEMLSSAASGQVTGSASRESVSVLSGLRDGASENMMMSRTWVTTPGADQSTGLTPFLSFTDNQQAQPANEVHQPERQDSSSTQAQSSAADSRRSSNQAGSLGTPAPATQPGLSPSGVFNFSPGPSGVPGTSVDFLPQTNRVSGSQAWPPNWAPPVGPDGVQPSGKTEGPWRNVETMGTVFPTGSQPQGVQGNQPGQSGQNADVDMTQALFGGDEALQQQLLLDLFWPGWPANLPEPHIVNDLVEAFFDQVPNLPRLLHRPRFLARLALPPTHSNFPHPALIHAICASAASWCPPETYQKSKIMQSQFGADEKPSDPRMTLAFGLRQAAFGKDAVQDGLNTGNRLFDVVRAMIILCRVFIDDTRMLECWAYSGLVARMILPLGLNVRSAELSLKSVMLPPPADILEREERRAAVWMAFYHDTIASSASGWGTSIHLDELTVPLPISARDFEAGAENATPNPQDAESTDFWTRHPVVDSFVMVIKASVLMNRVNRFVRKWKNRHLREDDDLDGLNKPEFRELSNAIACLQMSFPVSLRNPTKLNAKKKLDIDLIAAHMLPHAAVICLYEPFADICDPNDQPARRILSAAQSIVSIVQQLASSVTDGAQNFSSIMHSSASVCLVTSARTSLLFYRHALNLRDFATAESHRMDIEIIRMALGQFGLKFKIGHHHAQLIEYFLDRASNPTFEKLQAHYPEHPRPGAPELHPNSNFGVCILNALNVKRGFWRSASQIASTGVSPFGSTPDSSAAGASSVAGGGGGQRPSSSSGHSGSASRASAATHIESPHHLSDARQTESPIPIPGSRKASESTSPNNNNDLNSGAGLPVPPSSSMWFIPASSTDQNFNPPSSTYPIKGTPPQPPSATIRSVSTDSTGAAQRNQNQNQSQPQAQGQSSGSSGSGPDSFQPGMQKYFGSNPTGAPIGRINTLEQQAAAAAAANVAGAGSANRTESDMEVNEKREAVNNMRGNGFDRVATIDEDVVKQYDYRNGMRGSGGSGQLITDEQYARK